MFRPFEIEIASTSVSRFPGLMEVGKCCSVGSISHALYDVGGEYRLHIQAIIGLSGG